MDLLPNHYIYFSNMNVITYPIQVITIQGYLTLSMYFYKIYKNENPYELTFKIHSY
jgi:hypothetical protein